MKRCPRCGAESFYVSAHVIQDWLVDCNKTFLQEIDSCVEVTHFPDDQDIWECANCRYSATGEIFNCEKHTNV